MHLSLVKNMFARVSGILNPQKWASQSPDAKNKTLIKSLRLLQDYGFIRNSGVTGQYQLLPLGVRVLQKLINIIDKNMVNIGAQKIVLPTMTGAEHWKKSGRFDAIGKEMFCLEDRHNKPLCLGPTFEESVTDLVSSIYNPSYKNFPMKLYQITRKYRDELKPRFGLLRSREFYMKDLYSFDINLEEARKTYESVCQAYENIFKELEITDYLKVQGDTGVIGGMFSHEYHILSNIGEDLIKVCPNCKSAVNSQLDDAIDCKECGVPYEVQNGIEIGHTFLLGKKYSEIFKARFLNSDMKLEYLEMGCYGIGVTRLIAAVVELLSAEDSIRWPKALAPYKICIVPPKAGSKEAEAGLMADHLFKALSKFNPDEVIMDDRTNLTIGQRLLHADKIGYPFLVICGKGVLESVPKIELFDVYNRKKEMLTHAELMDRFKFSK